MIDLHSHILPGLDDGAQSIDESLEMAHMAARDGTTVLVATPHQFDGIYNVPRAAILEGVRALQKRLNEERIDLRILPGADVHVEPDLSQRLRNGEALALADGDRYLLVEFPSDVVPRALLDVLFDLRAYGLTPIITHPERNFEVQEGPGLMREFIESGSLAQLTAGGVTGRFGERAEQCAHELLRRRLAHLVASDAHSPRHRRPGLSEARETVAELLGDGDAQEIFVHRPEKVLSGETIDVPVPLEPERLGWRELFLSPRG